MVILLDIAIVNQLKVFFCSDLRKAIQSKWVRMYSTGVPPSTYSKAKTLRKHFFLKKFRKKKSFQIGSNLAWYFHWKACPWKVSLAMEIMEMSTKENGNRGQLCKLGFVTNLLIFNTNSLGWMTISNNLRSKNYW